MAKKAKKAQKKKGYFNVLIEEKGKVKRKLPPPRKTTNSRKQLNLNPLTHSGSLLHMLYRDKQANKFMDDYKTKKKLTNIDDINAEARYDLINKTISNKAINEILYSFGGKLNKGDNLVRNMKMTSEAADGIRRMCVEFVRKLCDRSQNKVVKRTRTTSGVGKVQIDNVEEALTEIYPGLSGTLKSKDRYDTYYTLFGNEIVKKYEKHANKNV